MAKKITTGAAKKVTKPRAAKATKAVKAVKAVKKVKKAAAVKKTAVVKKAKAAPKADAALAASRAMAIKLARLADDRHCTDIVVMEVERVSPVAKHFVIGTGTSEQQIRSVAREMQDVGAEDNFKAFGSEGMQQGRWVILDLVDVVVHLFDAEFRRFYDLEMLWGDSPKIRWQRATRKKSEK